MTADETPPDVATGGASEQVGQTDISVQPDVELLCEHWHDDPCDWWRSCTGMTLDVPERDAAALKTVQDDIEELTITSKLARPAKTLGMDGKVRPTAPYTRGG